MTDQYREKMALAGWVEYTCPECGQLNGHFDTAEQVSCSDGVGMDLCDDCKEVEA